MWLCTMFAGSENFNTWMRNALSNGPRAGIHDTFSYFSVCKFVTWKYKLARDKQFWSHTRGWAVVHFDGDLMHFMHLIKRANGKYPASCWQACCSGWDLAKKNKVCKHTLICKNTSPGLFSVEGMKDSVVHHILIKSSSTDAKPCMQKYSEEHAYRSWRTVTNWEVWPFRTGVI